MADETTRRRTFLAAILHWACGLFLAGVAYCGSRFVLDPLRAKSQSRKKYRVAMLEGVPDDKPLRVVVEADRWDAYVHHPPGPIGTVWLTRDGSSDGAKSVRCFQAACPHLGCGIDYVAGRNVYLCPCHVSEFASDGSRQLGPSPRAMDELPVTITPPDADGKQWVEIEYAEFATGTAEKKQV